MIPLSIRSSAALVLLVLLSDPSAQAAEPAPAPRPDFDRTVAPLLVQRCLDCHSGPKPKGGLDLSRRQAALAGGDRGPAIVPGKLEDSLLWQQVERGKMPPKKPL